jgi:uncharacterized RDD family membrane protein YckC
MPVPSPTFIVRGDDGNDYGPVDLVELREWVRENRAGLGTTVKRDEPGALWQPWQYHPELVALLAEARVAGSTLNDSGLVLAPLARRMVAFVIDIVLIYIPVSLIFLVVLKIGRPDIFAKWMLSSAAGDLSTPPFPTIYDALLNVLIFGGIILYMACFVYAHGRTPGKSLLRLRVVDENGDQPNALKSLIRALVLSASVCLFYLPLLYAFVHPQRRALHDLAAGTSVVEL